jgi:hypothetical protein
MRAVTATAIVRPDHTLTVQLPADIPPGARTVVIVLEDANEAVPNQLPFLFHPHPVRPADPTCTYRREDLCGDDGR